MLTRKTLDRFAALLSEVYRQEGCKDFRKCLAPEVVDQAAVIEKCLYGLLDRLAYCHIGKDGRPLHIDGRTSRAYMATVRSIRENEGDDGNSMSHWFNLLDRFPDGTLDGVLKVEKGVERAMARRKKDGLPG